MPEAKTPQPPSTSTAWLDKAAAEAMDEIERIYVDACAALDRALSTEAPARVPEIPEQPGAPSTRTSPARKKSN